MLRSAKYNQAGPNNLEEQNLSQLNNYASFESKSNNTTTQNVVEKEGINSYHLDKNTSGKKSDKGSNNVQPDGDSQTVSKDKSKKEESINFDEVILDPSLDERVKRATGECSAGDPKKGVGLFNEVVVEILEKQVESIIMLTKYQQEALYIMDEIIRRGKKDAKTFQRKGRLLNELGRKTEALECFELAIEKDKKDWRSRSYKGTVLRELGRVDEAIQSFSQINQDEVEVKDVDDCIALANACDYMDKFQQAISWYEKGKDFDPLKPAIYNGIANIMIMIGKPKEAFENYKKAIELNPECSVSHAGAADALCDLGKNDEALKYYTKALELDPKDTMALNNKAILLIDMNKYEEAEEACRKGIEMDPQYPPFYHALGVVLTKTKRHAEALEDFAKAIELRPNACGFYFQRGKCLLELGKQEEAMADFQRARSMQQSTDPSIQNRLVEGSEDLKCLNQILNK